jgi:threonine/homoserine/homoserine lactone efflux protein
MIRSILGFALFAVAVWLGLKLVFGLLGWVFGLAMWILWVAGIGFLIYLALRLVSPSTADKVRDTIRGKRGSTA